MGQPLLVASCGPTWVMDGCVRVNRGRVQSDHSQLSDRSPTQDLKSPEDMSDIREPMQCGLAGLACCGVMSRVFWVQEASNR